MNENGSYDGRPKNTSGRLLESAREGLGLSLEEVSRRTGIPASTLESMEREDTTPSGVFRSRVFLRNYTDYLGLDGSALSHRRKPEKPTGETPQQAPPAEAAQRETPRKEASRKEALQGKSSQQEVPEQAERQQETPLEEAPPEIIVEARGVYKSYRAEEHVVYALEDVSLKIERGALVAVMGPSGCGKTTLLNVLSGLDEMDRGEVFIGGEPLHALNDARRTGYRARHMGFVFQGFNLMPVLSAVENVELPLLVGGAGVRAARGRALEVLEQVRLADRAHHRPNQLSGGQQQRVAIARALVSEPDIIWADEPTGNLDSDTSREILDLLLQLNHENGQTFIVVTHDPGVGSLMDRVVRMQDGKIISGV